MKDLVPGIGVLTSSGLGFGPLSAVLQCRKTGSLGEVNPDPFPILLGNAVGWVLYAGATRNSYIFAANVSNVLMGFFFCLTGYALTPDFGVRRKMEILCLFFLSLWMGVGFFCAMIDDFTTRTSILGILCNVVVIILFASPLSTIVKVVTTKSSASINRPFTAIQVFNCLLWLGYGLVIGDMYVWVPNAIGLSLGLAQVFLICVYPKGKPVVLPNMNPDLEEPLANGSESFSDGHES